MNRLLFIVFILAGCGSGEEGKIRQSVPGVYTRHFDAHYSTGDDTLFISRLNDGNTYRVIRKSTYIRMRNKVQVPSEQKVESWIVVYDYKNKNLYEAKRERLLVPLPDSNRILVGNTAYLKIE